MLMLVTIDPDVQGKAENIRANCADEFENVWNE